MLKNKDLQTQLDDKGFVIIDLFSGEALDEFITAFQSLHNFPLENKMFFSNLQQDKPEYQKAARKVLRTYFEENLQDLFQEVEWMEAVFIIKPPHFGTFANHQDWSMVDENHYRSLGVWCPLIDVDANNGTFCIVEGSHKFYKTYRSPSIPWIYNQEGLNEVIDQYKLTLSLSKGQAVVFDHACIHSTVPNQSDAPRPAVFTGIRPKESPIHHYFHHKDSGQIEGFEVDGDFLYSYDYVSRPEGPNVKSLGFVDYTPPVILPKELERKIKKQLNKGKSLFSRARSLFAH